MNYLITDDMKIIDINLLFMNMQFLDFLGSIKNNAMIFELIIIKMFNQILVKPLQYLFNFSLFNETFLPLKKFFFSPVLKSSENYRPISKLSILLKTFEAIHSKKLSYLFFLIMILYHNIRRFK